MWASVDSLVGSEWATQQGCPPLSIRLSPRAAQRLSTWKAASACDDLRQSYALKYDADAYSLQNSIPIDIHLRPNEMRPT